MRLVWKIGAIVACVLLVACGSGEDDPVEDATPADAPATSIASPTATVPESSIGNIVWSESTDGETGAPIEPVEVFTPESPAIIASIEVTNIPVDTEFTATWTINDQPIEGSDMHVQAEGEIDHGWVTFQFTREDGTYPTGQLGVVITSGSGELREGSIEITFP